MTAFVSNEEWMRMIDWRSRLTEDEHDSLDKIEREWRRTLPSTVLQELLEVYPSGLAAARRAIHRRIKEVKNLASSLPRFREAWSDAINKMPPSSQWEGIAWLDEEVDKWDKEYTRLLGSFYFKLKSTYPQEVEVNRNGITDEQIARAKAVPITSLIKVNRAHKAVCLWHAEKHPSLHVYADHAYCFVCNKMADAIDVYMALNNVDFKAAVRAMAV